MSSDSISYPAPGASRLSRSGRGPTDVLTRLRSRVLAYPELLGLLGLTALLNLWNLSINGWANTYYSAAIRSMSTSWHDFLFGALDKTGLMTVDKPPLALWVQALSARIFGFNSLSILVPEALMGVVAVGLVYDMTRRRFGRVAGFVAGLAFAATPITVAVARHNNPDELLILCCVAALWFALRALETGRTKWLIWCGVFVGLGFETKMGVALLIVPGIVAAYLWIAPRGRLAALRQLLAGGVAMVAVGLAWPLLVTLTPAADRPWISGTSDNSIWSLIFGYNGLGRVAGQSGGPGGGTGGPGGGVGGGGGIGSTLFGGATGPFRLLQSGLGDQAGWLLGFAVVAGIALLVLSRLRRRDPRTGWVIAVGGGLLTSAVVFSFAAGIFHPYYVSFFAPFAAALIGAGVGTILPRSHGGVAPAGRAVRIIAPLLIAGGLTTELVVLGGLNGQLAWATPVMIVLAGGAAGLLALKLSPRLRAAFVAVALAALLAAPAVWAVQTVGHPTNGTFPSGGPTAAQFGGGGRGFGGGRGGSGGFGGGGPASGPPSGGAQGGRPAGAAPGGFAPPGLFGNAGGAPGGAGSGPRAGFGGGGGGQFGGDSASLTAAINYAQAHGGGAIGVSSQSSAAAAILSSGGNVAGLGGFSGRESSVTPQWLAAEVSSGRLRWVIPNSSTTQAQLPGDTRTGSQDAFSIVAKACKAVTVKSSSGSSVTMYDCLGRASAILAAARG
jgi:4-amino-4-deoxy-L-arabinose transferase-like glycosyltransferase